MILIEDVLAEFAPDQRKFRVDFDRTDEGYVARAVLMLSAVALTVETEGPGRDQRAVVDQLAEKLADAVSVTAGLAGDATRKPWAGARGPLEEVHHDYGSIGRGA